MTAQVANLHRIRLGPLTRASLQLVRITSIMNVILEFKLHHFYSS
jgi:hypothetical protein